MQKELIEVRLYSGYGGASGKAEVRVGPDCYVLEVSEIEKALHEAVAKHGYRIEKTNRQKHWRFVIND